MVLVDQKMLNMFRKGPHVLTTISSDQTFPLFLE